MHIKCLQSTLHVFQQIETFYIVLRQIDLYKHEILDEHCNYKLVLRNAVESVASEHPKNLNNPAHSSYVLISVRNAVKCGLFNKMQQNGP